MKKRLLTAATLLILIGAGVLFYALKDQNQNSVSEETPTNEPINTPQPEIPQEQELQPTEEKPTYDITTPSSITFIANKNRPLPADYVPADLIVPDVRLRLAPSEQQMQFRSVAHGDLQAMFAAAQADGVELVFGSGYRSYALQKQFYDGYVARDGQAAADRYSARPGTSEHQTGLAFDVTSPSQTCHLEICFENTPQGQWMAKNAHNYGFVSATKKEKKPSQATNTSHGTSATSAKSLHKKYIRKTLL